MYGREGALINLPGSTEGQTHGGTQVDLGLLYQSQILDYDTREAYTISEEARANFKRKKDTRSGSRPAKKQKTTQAIAGPDDEEVKVSGSQYERRARLKPTIHWIDDSSIAILMNNVNQLIVGLDELANARLGAHRANDLDGLLSFVFFSSIDVRECPVGLAHLGMFGQEARVGCHGFLQHSDELAVVLVLSLFVLAAAADDVG